MRSFSDFDICYTISELFQKTVKEDLDTSLEIKNLKKVLVEIKNSLKIKYYLVVSGGNLKHPLSCNIKRTYEMTKDIYQLLEKIDKYLYPIKSIDYYDLDNCKAIIKHIFKNTIQEQEKYDLVDKPSDLSKKIAYEKAKNCAIQCVGTMILLPIMLPMIPVVILFGLDKDKNTDKDTDINQNF